MKTQIITKDGEPEYAVLPYQDYLRLLEDAEMMADVRAFDSAQIAPTCNEELIPSEVVDRLLDGESPVRVWREYRGMTAAKVAKSCRVTAAAISQIESGKRKPSVDLLKKLAATLNVDLDDLVTAEGGPEAYLKPCQLT